MPTPTVPFVPSPTPKPDPLDSRDALILAGLKADLPVAKIAAALKVTPAAVYARVERVKKDVERRARSHAG